MVHGAKYRIKDNSFRKEQRHEEKEMDDLEMTLLKWASEDEQAQKRTRGPYRKSPSVACT